MTRRFLVRRVRVAGLTGTLLLGAAPAVAQVTGIRNTKHNLSAASGNPVRATTESQVCVYCHTPHSARVDAPLWNRSSPTSNYVPYTSPSLQALPQQPNGFSKLCLSCHDGSIAIGSVLNPPNPSVSTTIAMTGTGAGGMMPAGRTLLGANLTNDHPVSFVYDDITASDDGELVTGVAAARSSLYEGATRA